VPLILACLFPGPAGLLVFKGLIWTRLIPSGCLIRILRPREFIVLQREKNIHRALVSGMQLLLLSVVSLSQSQFVEAV